jgi:hypothetical protein
MTGSFRGARVALSLTAFVAAACTPIDAPDQNAPALSDLTGTPSVSAITTAAQGLIRGMRDNNPTQLYSVLGREGYNLDPSNPQTEPAFYTTLGDLAQWAGPYRNIKLANLVLEPLDRVVGLTDAEKEGIRGFAKTVKAVELLKVIRGTDVYGALLDAAENATDPPEEIASKDAVYTEIFKLLDEAKVHLQGAGETFRLNLGPGFVGLDTPPTFLQFNRAVRARASIDLQRFAEALVDLNESFLDTSKPLSFGMYFTYSLASGDVTNNFFEGVPRVFFVHPRILAGAQEKANGDVDDRVTRKLREMPEPLSRYGFVVSHVWNHFPTPAAPNPFLKNEELILLRAEANLGLGNLPAAVQDINFVRVNSGGLEPITLPYTPGPGDPPTLLDELLYNKTYSMMWEAGSWSWLDARHYDKLEELPHDLEGHVVFPHLRIADLECDARDPKPAGCTSPPGV